jgi:hypothetical protein
MLRRDFLRRSTRSLGAAFFAKSIVARAALIDPDPLPQKFKAQDEVGLGRTGIRTSRLAMGTGTIGFGGRSNQTKLGTSPLTNLLLNGYQETGYVSSTRQTRMGAIPTSPPPLNNSLAIGSPSSRRRIPVMPLASGQISIDSGESLESIISTLS